MLFFTKTHKKNEVVETPPEKKPLPATQPSTPEIPAKKEVAAAVEVEVKKTTLPGEKETPVEKTGEVTPSEITEKYFQFTIKLQGKRLAYGRMLRSLLDEIRTDGLANSDQDALLLLIDKSVSVYLKPETKKIPL
jgi:hypothetical protein